MEVKKQRLCMIDVRHFLYTQPNCPHKLCNSLIFSSIAVTQRAGQDLAFVTEVGSIPKNRLTL